MTKKCTQADQVIDTMKRLGGYSTLGRLYQEVDTSHWGTKTPQESIRRIVQASSAFFRVQPGLWALEECRDDILSRFDLASKEDSKVELFTHGYFQGVITEIGKMRNFLTYIPAQDQNRKFLNQPLIKVCDTIKIPPFSYTELTGRARTVDAIWFNDRRMPHSMFEVEHSTDMQNSFMKFCDLQDFNTRFIIVAPQNRHSLFDKVKERTAFRDIRDRVFFHSYEAIANEYNSLCLQESRKGWI